MKRLLSIYALSALLTTMAYADAYQNLLAAYNDQNAPESLHEQLGKNLSKRVTTDAERSNLSFIAIYAEIAQWNKKPLSEQIKTIVKFAFSQINYTPLLAAERQYRIDHYVHLIMLCVASHMNNERNITGNDFVLPELILTKIENEVTLLKSSLHPDVYKQLLSLKAADIEKMLIDFNFIDSYELAKGYVEFYRSVENSPGKMPAGLLRLAPDQEIKYQEEIKALNDRIREAENSPDSVTALPEGDSDETQIIAGPEGVSIRNKRDGSLSNNSDRTSLPTDDSAPQDAAHLSREHIKILNTQGLLKETIENKTRRDAFLVHFSRTGASGKNSSLTSNTTLFDDIHGAKFRATQQKTEEQIQAERENKQKQKAAQEKIDIIDEQIRLFEDDKSARDTRKNNIKSEIERKIYDNLKKEKEQEGLRSNINKINDDIELSIQEAAAINQLNANLVAKEKELMEIKKIINKINEERKKVLAKEIKILLEKITKSSKIKKNIEKNLPTLNQEVLHIKKKITAIDNQREQSEIEILALQNSLRDSEREIEMLISQISTKKNEISDIRKKHGLKELSVAQIITQRRESIEGEKTNQRRAITKDLESDFNIYSEEDEVDTADESAIEADKKARQKHKTKTYSEFSPTKRKEYREATRLRRGKRAEKLRLEELKAEKASQAEEKEERNGIAAKQKKKADQIEADAARAKTDAARAKTEEEKKETDRVRTSMLDSAKKKARDIPSDSDDENVDWS